MSDVSVPVLSVVLATRDSFEPIRRSIRNLAAQTAAGRMELIIVAPSAATLRIDEGALDGFAAHQVVTMGSFSAGEANAAGVRAARAPVVALTEDHVLLEPTWAEALIDAHRGPWAAVSGVLRNANPASATSWAALFISYGPWMEPASGGPAEFLPGHNTSYKRNVLLGFGDRLPGLLETEAVLHWRLRELGHALYLDAAVRIAHINLSRFTVWAGVQFYAGRVFAASRAARWSRGKRLRWAAAAPAIPAVRFARIVRGTARKRALRGQFVRAAPAIVVGLLIDGLGQMLGYALGLGGSDRAMARYEYQRERFLCRRDRAALASAG